MKLGITKPEKKGLVDFGLRKKGTQVIKRSNGHVTISSYLAATGQRDGRCVGQGLGACTVVGLSYAYDGWGNLTAHNQSGGAPGAYEEFEYDVLHRLTQAKRVTPNLAAVTYRYDAAGNLTAKSDYSQAAAGSYQYTDASHRHAVSGVTPAMGLAIQFDYDGNSGRRGGVE